MMIGAAGELRRPFVTAAPTGRRALRRAPRARENPPRVSSKSRSILHSSARVVSRPSDPPARRHGRGATAREIEKAQHPDRTTEGNAIDD
eukprot:29630-Pelagococcus_subviridis.AAC.4